MQWDSATGAGFTTGNPWRTVNADYTTKNVATQQATAGSLWNLYHDLITLRNSETALRQGTYVPVTASNEGVFAYLRQYNNEHVLVVINMGNSTVNDLSLSLANGGITPGTYTMQGKLGTANLDVTIGSDGGFTNVNAGTVVAKGYKVYKLTGTLATPANELDALSLYPNPAATSFRINRAVTQLDIYTLTGQLVKKAGRVAQNETVDISGLQRGVYLVKVTDVMGRKSTIKLLKE